MSTSPTQRTLAYLRETGYHCDVVERFIRRPELPGGGFRKDFMSFGDILAFSNTETVMVQSCGTSYSSHLKSLLSNPNVALWLAGPRKVMLIGWRKLKVKRGGKATKWTPRVRKIKPGDFKA